MMNGWILYNLNCLHFTSLGRICKIFGALTSTPLLYYLLSRSWVFKHTHSVCTLPLNPNYIETPFLYPWSLKKLLSKSLNFFEKINGLPAIFCQQILRAFVEIKNDWTPRNREQSIICLWKWKIIATTRTVQKVYFYLRSINLPSDTCLLVQYQFNAVSNLEWSWPLIMVLDIQVVIMERKISGKKLNTLMSFLFTSVLR